ncbi:hypothetical protein Tco_0755020, partial [Tanacetum coccineum]
MVRWWSLLTVVDRRWPPPLAGGPVVALVRGTVAIRGCWIEASRRMTCHHMIGGSGYIAAGNSCSKRARITCPKASSSGKQVPSPNSVFRQLVEETCGTKVCEEQKQNMEDTMLDLLKICQQKELYCIHNNVEDLIESALNSKLLLINLNSQRLNKEEQEVKNIAEPAAKRQTRITSCLQNFKVISKESTIPLNKTPQISPVNAITHDLPTEEPEDSLIMGNEELSTIPEKESDEFIKSSVEDLIPIPRESEDTSGSDSKSVLPSSNDFSPIFEEKSVTFSNPLFELHLAGSQPMLQPSKGPRYKGLKTKQKRYALAQRWSSGGPPPLTVVDRRWPPPLTGGPTVARVQGTVAIRGCWIEASGRLTCHHMIGGSGYIATVITPRGTTQVVTRGLLMIDGRLCKYELATV